MIEIVSPPTKKTPVYEKECSVCGCIFRFRYADINLFTLGDREFMRLACPNEDCRMLVNIIHLREYEVGK